MKSCRWVGFLPFYLLTVILFIGVAAGGSRTATVIRHNTPVVRHSTVVIDAGHGGIDGGAVSCTGLRESALNLEIALRLEALMQLLGMNTVMIRSTDTSVCTEDGSIAAQKISDLKQRVKIVQQTQNAILVSIHQNTFSDSRYAGAQVFYGDAPGSRELAERVQQSLIRSLNPGSHRESKKGEGIYLLGNIDCVGILIECGFLTNPQEEALLRSAQYQKQLCCVIASELSKYANSG